MIDIKELRLVFEDVIGSECQIDENTSTRNLDEWDSIVHIALINSIQKKFKIEIPIEDAIELTIVEKIIEYINRVK